MVREALKKGEILAMRHVSGNAIRGWGFHFGEA